MLWWQVGDVKKWIPVIEVTQSYTGICPNHTKAAIQVCLEISVEFIICICGPNTNDERSKPEWTKLKMHIIMFCAGFALFVDQNKIGWLSAGCLGESNHRADKFLRSMQIYFCVSLTSEKESYYWQQCIFISWDKYNFFLCQGLSPSKGKLVI